MSSNINRPTGLGFHSNLQRECSICKHAEMDHFGRCLFYPACDCKGFSARDLDEAELAAMHEASKRVVPVEIDEDSWLKELVHDFVEN